MNEAELLQKFREDRSEAAFAQLVRRYAGLVYSVAKRRSASPALAEDIAQLVFIRFAKTPPRVKTGAELAAWLHRTTVHVTIDTWRSETRRRVREEKAVTMESTTVEPTVWEEVAPKLDEALDQLNEDDRRALLLRFFSQKTMHEVGTALGVSENAAKMRVSRAVDRLRTQMRVGGTVSAVAGLETILSAHCVEAAPIQLLDRLAAIKLSATAGAGGITSALTQHSSMKLAAAAAALVIVVAGIIHLTHQGGAQKPDGAAALGASDRIADMSKQEPVAPRTDPHPLALESPPVTKPVNIRFYVLDSETGAALAGTKIHIGYFGAGGMGEGHEVVTDGTGFAPIPEPDDSTKSRAPNVFVTAEGHVPKVVGFQNPVPAEYTIKLDPSVTASGIVIDEQGLPVPKVKIMVRSPGNVGGRIENVDLQLCSAVSANDGTWSYDYLPRDYTNEMQFVLSKPGYAVTLSSVPDGNPGPNNLILVIDKGFAVMGRITDSQGKPISKASLKTLWGDTNQRRSTHSDENGFFVLDGVSGQSQDDLYTSPLPETTGTGNIVLRGSVGKGPLHIDIAVQAEHFTPQIQRVMLSQITNVLNLTLQPGRVFRGRVIDEQGNPITGAVIRTDYDFDKQIERRFDWNAKTDADGRFEWSSAPTDEVCYWFDAPGYKAIRGLPLRADGDEHEITLKH